MKLFLKFNLFVLCTVVFVNGCTSYEQKAEKFVSGLTSDQFFLCTDIDKAAEIYNVYFVSDLKFYAYDLKTKESVHLFSLDAQTQTYLFHLKSKGRHQVIFLENAQKTIYSKDLRTLVKRPLVNANAGEKLEGICDVSIFLYTKEGKLYQYDAVEEKKELVYFGDSLNTPLIEEAESFPDSECEIGIYNTGFADKYAFINIFSPMLKISYVQTYLYRPETSPISTYLDSGINPYFDENTGTMKIITDDYVRVYGSDGRKVKENPRASKFIQMKGIPPSNVVAVNDVSNMVCYFMVGGGFDNGGFFFYDGEEEHKIDSYENELGEKNHFSFTVRSKENSSIVESEWGWDIGQPIAVIFVGHDFTYDYLLKFDMREGKASLIDLGSSITKRSNYYKIKQGSEIRYYDLEGDQIPNPESGDGLMDNILGLFDLFL